MKKNGKIIALTAVLALCLLLTGCYVPPDDVNNDGEQTVNKPRFDVYSPVPVNTPTTAPNGIAPDETQATANPGSAQNTIAQTGTTPASSTGSPSDWSDWGNTPIPMGVSINLGGSDETAAPGTTIGVVSDSASPSMSPSATPTVSPSPTPPSLQKGFKGSDAVRSLQKRLKELGYYSGSVDGDFGEGTEKAVKEFQKANGLTADGKAGEKTLSKLNSKNAVSYKEAHATATPKKTATPKPTATPNLSKDYYLRNGDSGKRVETLQRRLIELGWLDGKVTGKFDDATDAAVRAFQKKTSGLYEDGVAGPETLRALYSSKAARTTKAAASIGETLEFGSEGSDVKKMQQKLKDLGYLSGSADGKFGVATQAAVIAFQKNNNLTADGKAGSATLSKLYSGTANKSNSSAKIDSSDKHKSGRDTSGIASTGYETLQSGSKGTAVKNLQQKLKQLGYYSGSVDGSFGDATEAAVMAFQLRNDLTVDGKAGPATQRKLYGTGGNSPISYSALRPGDSGTAVRNLQYTLYELGYYDGSMDGDYGQTTTDAVRAFQDQNNLSVDGIAGSDTLAMLYSSEARAAKAAKTEYETVRPGATGDIVYQIQDCLMQMGYLDQITSVYDDKTTQAVKNFQQANGLDADGICGSKTQMVLFGY